jgi:hypothetical protein
MARLVAENVDSQTTQGFELAVAENIGYLDLLHDNQCFQITFAGD